MDVLVKKKHLRGQACRLQAMNSSFDPTQSTIPPYIPRLHRLDLDLFPLLHGRLQNVQLVHGNHSASTEKMKILKN